MKQQLIEKIMKSKLAIGKCRGKCCLVTNY